MYIISRLRDPGATTKDDLSVVLGEFDLSSDSDSFDTKRWTFDRLINSIVFQSSCFSSRKNVQLEIDPIVHEDYQSPKPNSNDIALLKLAEAVNLDTYTPACLASTDADYTGQNGRVYGIVQILQFFWLSILSKFFCESFILASDFFDF